jgi:hypothetical protein
MGKKPLTPEQRERNRAYLKAWREKHRAERRAYGKRYHEEHREQRLAYDKRWHAENREQALARRSAGTPKIESASPKNGESATGSGKN